MNEGAKNNAFLSGVRKLFKNGVVIIFVIVVALVAILTKGKSLSSSNLMNVLVQTTSIGILAIGMSLVIIDRGIDLSVGGIAAFTAAVGAILMTRYQVPWIACVILMLLIGLAVGAINGAAIAVLKMPAFITTMAMLNMSRGMAHYLLGGTTVYGLPAEHAVFGQGDFLKIPVCVWMLVICMIVVAVVLRFTKFGRELYAMGGNPRASWIAGINVNKNRIMIYMISGLMSAIASLIITSKIMCAQVTIGEGIELNAIASSVIGGVSMAGGEGGVVGAVLGAIVMTMINNGMNLLAVSPYLQTAIQGFVIFIAIAADVIRRRKELKD